MFFINIIKGLSIISKRYVIAVIKCITLDAPSLVKYQHDKNGIIIDVHDLIQS